MRKKIILRKNTTARIAERITVWAIPYLVLLLTILFILDNPFWTLLDLRRFDTALLVFDAVIIFFFTADLVFKWIRIHELKLFIKLYWIDILAVFPIYLILRTYSEVRSLFRIGEEITLTAQTLGHEAVMLRDAELLKEQ